mmetsp:Transcript_53966/g.115914  ORF Transcript_53966/g.115914 Transcript_53966/m.115914 type:complete len:309 (+) Transcript_53966:325-1251(+)
MREAFLFPLRLISVPGCDGISQGPVGAMRLVVHVVLVLTTISVDLVNLRIQSGRDHPHRTAVLDIPDIRRLVQLLVCLIHRQLAHEARLAHLEVVLRVVEQVLLGSHPTPCADASGERDEVGRIHARIIDHAHPSPIPIAVAADHSLHVVQSVEGEVPEEAECLHNVGHVLQLSAARQVQCALGHPFHSVLYVLGPAPEAREEGDIADAETAVLSDLHLLEILGKVHRMVVEGVSKAAEAIHGLEHLQHQPAGHRYGGLMDEPAGHTRTREVLPPGNQVDHLRAVLDTSSQVLNGEGAVAKDGRDTAR